MRSEAPPLLPIFRSRHQADLLTILFLHPARDFTATDLATRLDAPISTVHQELRRLEQADLLVARTVGRARLLRANMANRVSQPLAQLLLVTFGPQVALEAAFAALRVDLVLIYGSWAARYQGMPGPPPNDVDVLVVGDLNRAAIYDAADHAEQRLGIPVNPTLCSRSRWDEAEDPLIKQIKSSSTVTVIDHRPNDKEEIA